jgi:hypothetical protein
MMRKKESGREGGRMVFISSLYLTLPWKYHSGIYGKGISESKLIEHDRKTVGENLQPQSVKPSILYPWGTIPGLQAVAAAHSTRRPFAWDLIDGECA